MKFVDSTEIVVSSGDGGGGMVSFRAARNLPKLGADGGDGGHGGHVFFKGHRGLNTLSHLYYRKQYRAGHGERGGTNGCTGASGDDLVIEVPLGTIATDQETGERLVEVMEHEKYYEVLHGGHRGLGNQRYLSSIHQAPVEFTAGTAGETKRLGLELKLIAEVGLAGFPNAGKSTLLSAISAARPKVADYPFTTLEPQLGVVAMGSLVDQYGASFVMADIPGLIEGASEGRGLGHEFLRHLERTKTVIYVIDEHGFEHEPIQALSTLRNELKQYSKDLFDRPSLVVLTKSDLKPTLSLCDDDGVEAALDIKLEMERLGFEVMRVSSVSGDGLDDLKRTLFAKVSTDREDFLTRESQRAPERPVTPEQEGYKVIVKSASNAALGLS